MTLPSKEAVVSVMELAERTPEAAEYVCYRFEAILIAEKALAQFSELMEGMRAYAASVLQQMTFGNFWKSESIPSIFANREQQQISAATPPKAADAPRTTLQVVMRVILGEEGQLERRYASGGKKLDDANRTYMDSMVKGWIAEEKMIRHEHVMYEATDDGQIKKDAKGQPICVSQDVLREKLQSQDRGLVAYIERESHKPGRQPCELKRLEVKIAKEASASNQPTKSG
jgi:hypothetical protein